VATKTTSLDDLYVHQLKDLYSAEKQLIAALPKMSKAASSSDLKRAFDHHLTQTRTQVTRLEEIFTDRPGSPRGKKCVGMEGLIKEGKEVLESDMTGSVRDAALIAAAQRVEHYEMAGYGTVRAYAELLGDRKAVSLLDKSLEEESMANEKLNSIAMKQVNNKAVN
jgi:ferritin-like metal-binding protein YciE